MFERFTNRARRVVVVSQEEARELGHNYIGTEHILLGLLAAEGGLALQVLQRFGMSLIPVREEVTARVGTSGDQVKARIPFTPRAKKVLELSLREALALHHNYIGTEHILLGLAHEADGVGPQIMKAHGADYMALRQGVLDVLPAERTTQGHRWLRRRSGAGELAEAAGIGDADEPEEPPTTPAAEASLARAARLAGPGPVGSHHLLLATLEDPNTAVARTLTGLGVDLDQAREALRSVDVTDTTDERPADRGRRTMVLRLTDDRLTIEATDPEILRVARGTLEVLGDYIAEPGTIRGDQPAGAGLGRVWQALRDGLEDILRSAMDAREGAAAEARAEAASGRRAQEAGQSQEASQPQSGKAGPAQAAEAGPRQQAGDDNKRLTEDQ
jgi:ATP-dependent Clp protease ATP-binding subunit ClpC